MLKRKWMAIYGKQMLEKVKSNDLMWTYVEGEEESFMKKWRRESEKLSHTDKVLKSNLTHISVTYDEETVESNVLW